MNDWCGGAKIVAQVCFRFQIVKKKKKKWICLVWLNLVGGFMEDQGRKTLTEGCCQQENLLCIRLWKITRVTVKTPSRRFTYVIFPQRQRLSKFNSENLVKCVNSPSPLLRMEGLINLSWVYRIDAIEILGNDQK